MRRELGGAAGTIDSNSQLAGFVHCRQRRVDFIRWQESLDSLHDRIGKREALAA
jgi:hypothetical protein